MIKHYKDLELYEIIKKVYIIYKKIILKICYRIKIL